MWLWHNTGGAGGGGGDKGNSKRQVLRGRDRAENRMCCDQAAGWTLGYDFVTLVTITLV